MIDIIERLEQVQGDNEDAREAAAEIKQLREQIDTLRELRKYDQIEIARLKELHLAAAVRAERWQEDNKRLRALEPKP
jgi:DNA-binding protein H-NS